MATTFDSDVKIAGGLKVGNVSAPPEITAGSGTMNTTNRAAGSIHLRQDTDTLPEVFHGGEVEKIGLAGNAIECRLSNLVANTANTYQTHAPRDMIITGVRRRYTTAPASAGGTVVAGITVAGNQILASASENEKGLSNDTLTTHNLTSTTSYLKCSKGDKIIITVTSNNADMTGGTGPAYFIDYDAN